MYRIRVLHNYLYKLIGELPYLLPAAKYCIQDDVLVTSNPQMVGVAKYVFQFQPDLLVIEHSPLPKQRKIQKGNFENDLRRQSVLELA